MQPHIPDFQTHYECSLQLPTRSRGHFLRALREALSIYCRVTDGFLPKARESSRVTFGGECHSAALLVLFMILLERWQKWAERLLFVITTRSVPLPMLATTCGLESSTPDSLKSNTGWKTPFTLIISIRHNHPSSELTSHGGLQPRNYEKEAIRICCGGFRRGEKLPLLSSHFALGFPLPGPSCSCK